MTMTAFPGMWHRLFLRHDLSLSAAALRADPFLRLPCSLQHKPLKLMAAFGAFQEHDGHSIPPTHEKTSRHAMLSESEASGEAGIALDEPEILPLRFTQGERLVPTQHGMAGTFYSLIGYELCNRCGSRLTGQLLTHDPRSFGQSV